MLSYLQRRTPNRLDLEAELAAVTSAHNSATQERSRIQQQIGQMTDIEILSGLHAEWEAVCEEQAAAYARKTELTTLLAQLD